MNFFESLNIAFSSIFSNRLRSFLTMLGVVIGVASIVSLISVGQGAGESVTSSIRGLGSNLLFIMPGQETSRGGPPMGMGSVQTLVYEDSKAITDSISNIKALSPEVAGSYSVVFENNSTSTSIVGTNPEYETVRNVELASGRFITSEDISGVRKVAVLGSTVLENLGSADLIGKRILINRIPFTVVGIMVEKGQAGFINQDDQIIIPITTAIYRLSGSANLRSINIAVDSEENMSNVQADVERLLRQRHRLREDEPNDFMIRNQTDILGTLSSIMGIFTVLLGGIASISLLVGGIGIMNIMLVSVTERTREIGIRKALGAKKRDILLQFLIEAVVLSGFGGILGLVFGMGGSKLISNFGGFTTAYSPATLLLAFSFSVIIGVFFGVLPANKAARLDPIEALRYE